MASDQTALVLFHREVLLPEIKRAVDEAVAPLSHGLAAVEKRLKKLEQRVDVSITFVHHANDQVGIVDLKLEALDSLWEVTKAIADSVGAKVPWRKPSEGSEEGVG